VFTGLVEDVGSVVQARATDDGMTLTVASQLAGQLADGDSIAVNGVCLTASQTEVRRFSADVMLETLRRSSLAQLREESRLNLELALRATSRLGGHIVQGHVDAVGTVLEVADDGFARRMTIRAASSVLRQLVERGSVAVDGVSLTISALGRGSFDVSLIPTTLLYTSLGELQAGMKVNLEVDILAKHILQLAGRTMALCDE